MFKTHGRLFRQMHRLADGLVVLLCWLGAFAMRFYVFGEGTAGLDLISYVKAGLVLAVVTVYFISKEGLYGSHRMSSRFDELRKLFKAHLLASVGFIVILYFIGGERISRLQIMIYFTGASFAFLGLRLVLRGLLRTLRRRGRNLRHVLLVGSGKALETYLRNAREYPDWGLRIVAWQDSAGANLKYQVPEFPGSLHSIIQDGTYDCVVIGYEGRDTAKLEQVMAALHNDVVPLVVLPDLTYSYIGSHMDSIAGLPALFVNQPNFSTTSVVSKRVFDIVASGLGLAVISPFLGAMALGVRLSSPGPIFFGQERVGLDGRRFKMWKFRTMRVGAHQSGDGVPGWTTENDPRKTKFGSFLRATSLDELPQLWNVFIGDMSLVGPRPEQPYYVEKFKKEIPAYMLRHKVKAGITGWAQVNGWRGDTSLHKRIECDLYYIRHWSIWLDVKILFLTFWKGFVNKNAY